jgi:hypothetical protein
MKIFVWGFTRLTTRQKTLPISTHNIACWQDIMALFDKMGVPMLLGLECLAMSLRLDKF